MSLSASAVQAVAAVVERPLFSLDQQTLISIGIQLFNACLLALALRHFLYKPVRAIMQKRTAGIKEQMRKAEESQASADALIALYEQKLRDIGQEQDALLEEAKAQASAERKAMLDTARADIAAMRRTAQEGIQSERERANEDLKRYITEAASHMAQKYIAFSMDEATQDKLFDESITELETLLWETQAK